MKEVVHQIWFGGKIPQDFQTWMASVRDWARARGMLYRLWTEAELWQEFGCEQELRTLKICMQTVPTATSYSFASDFFRMRLIAKYGGLYLDTDVDCRDNGEELPKEGGLYTGPELWNGKLQSTWCIWAPGKGGRAAARSMMEAARKAFNEQLPAGAPDLPSRFVQLMRRDLRGHGADNKGLGPAVFRRAVIPFMREAGYSCSMLPRRIAACRDKGAMLCHCNRGSWLERGADWNERAAAAKKIEEKDAAEPVWLKPQAYRVLPRACRRKKAEEKEESPADGLIIPRGTQRIVIFSNVTSDFEPRALPLQEGDHCIHINRARQYEKVGETPGTTHALVVRRGTNKENQRVIWYEPASTNGFIQVMHIQDQPMRQRRGWWREYCQRNPRQCPTSGFICWKLALEAAPSVPVVLVGFAPGENFGTPQWKGHAWRYEAEEYARANAQIVRPDTPRMQQREN